MPERSASPDALAHFLGTIPDHNPATCIYCRNDSISRDNPEDHRHIHDSAIGVSCFLDEHLRESVLMVQCACGHTREILGILHPEPAPPVAVKVVMFTEEHCGFRVIGAMLPESKGEVSIERIADGLLVYIFEVEGYRLWNYQAHAQDLVNDWISMAYRDTWIGRLVDEGTEELKREWRSLQSPGNANREDQED